ncbi:MAG: hypothetical protein KDB22_12675 [Planctomycetales bacterium]|nr:hypothetical protein [Planctomycetales bacterium]
MDETNPYAPPTTAPELVQEKFEDGRVWRDGQLMVIRSGAAIPQRCFVTGKPTNTSVDISLTWPGPFPHRLFSDWLGRKVKLSVPINPAVYRDHVRAVNFGFARLIFGITLVGCTLMLWGMSISWITLMFGALLIITGFYSCSRQPIALNILRVEDDLLILRDVHQDCLAELPPWK